MRSISGSGYGGEPSQSINDHTDHDNTRVEPTQRVSQVCMATRQLAQSADECRCLEVSSTE